MSIRVQKYAGSFAGDKDAAARIRDTEVVPALRGGKSVVLDFAGVDLATQSFVHALLASIVRENPEALEHIAFKNCNDSVRSLVEIVVDYAQQELSLEVQAD